jgi:6-phospho-3-hexuloisomerase
VHAFLLDEVRRAVEGVEEAATSRIIERILSSKRIFVYGAGRSGFVARCFTMRLKHLGMPIVRMSIDPTTPPRPDDCALIISGTGGTPSSVDYANLAHAGGAHVFGLTARGDSALARTGCEVVLVPVRTGDPAPHLAPLGTIFEEAALVYLDGVVAVLMERLAQSEEDMRRRHGVTR